MTMKMMSPLVKHLVRKVWSPDFSKFNDIDTNIGYVQDMSEKSWKNLTFRAQKILLRMDFWQCILLHSLQSMKMQ